MADRIVRANKLANAIRGGVRASNDDPDELCSRCGKMIRTRHHNGDYLVASMRHPGRNLTIHLFTRGAPLCASCVVDLLGRDGTIE